MYINCEMLLLNIIPYLNNDGAQIICIVGVEYIFGMLDNTYMTLLVALLNGYSIS